MNKKTKNQEHQHPFFTSDGVVPIYIQLKNFLKKQLQENPDLQRLPGTLELAKEYHVSKGTVTRALKLLVDENIICRIPHRGTLRCTAQDYADPQLNSRVFGLVFPAGGYSSWKDMIIPMQKKAEFSGFSLDIYLYNQEPGNLQQVLKRARKQSAGIALYLSNEKEIAVQDLYLCNYPQVIIGQKFEGHPISSVTADNHTAAKQITANFIHQGLKQIAVIFGENQDAAFTRTRIAGWRDAHLESGMAPADELIYYPDDKNPGGITDFLKKHRPDAIILSNNGDDWKTIVNAAAQSGIPRPRFASFILPSGGHKSFFADDTLFAELPIAEIGEAVIRLLVLTLQKAVSAPQKHEIGIKIYQKSNKKSNYSS